MKLHPTDRLSLGFGLFFLSLAAAWLTSRFITLTATTVAWFIAGGLVTLGVLGIAGTAASRRHTDDHRP